MSSPLNNKALKRYLGWKVYPWVEALKAWDKAIALQGVSGYAAEFGAGPGGISLWLAEQHGFRVLCTDIKAEAAARENVAGNSMITFEQLNLLENSLPDNHFDLVVMKSVLASLGTVEGSVEKAVDEIYRILKPGGLFLFAENQRGSVLHRLLRKYFIPWSNCKYFTPSELQQAMKQFSEVDMKTFGFFSVASQRAVQLITYPIDKMLNSLIPADKKYIAFGYAIK